MESGFQDKTFKELLRADVQKCVVPLVCCQEAFSISFPAVVVMNHVLAFLACFGMFQFHSMSIFLMNFFQPAMIFKLCIWVCLKVVCPHCFPIATMVLNRDG